MAFHKGQINFPNHSTPTYGNPQTQLQFNLKSHKNGSFSRVHKPKPIIIEKLLPYPKPSEYETTLTEGHSNMPETMLSSEKLAFAVQLAKMDIKKLKTMLNENGDVAHQPMIPVVKDVKKKTSVESEKTKKKKGIEKQRKEKESPQRHVLHLYPEPKETNVSDAPVKSQASKRTKPPLPPAQPIELPASSTTTKKDNEMKRLRNDLMKYSQALDIVVQKLNQEKFVEISNDDELKKERERDIIRAEEQRNRSARMLYMLQCKVEDLRNELCANKSNVRQTKKSQYTTKLASAHRAAVKALQTFVSHAPLYYNTAGKFPPMYKALALLIQQLTSLSTNNLLGAEAETTGIIEDLIDSLSKTDDRQHNSTNGGKKKKDKSKLVQIKQADVKKQYLDQRIDWLKKKADELNIKSFQGEEATPDRASSLKHALHTLKGEEFATDKKQASPLPKPVLKNKKPKSSVLLPNELKRRKLKVPSRPYHPQPPGNMNYAAATVVSKIREKPPIERKEKTPPASPRRVVFTDEEPSTPKKRDQQIIEEARALISPSQQRKYLPMDQSPSRSDDGDVDEARLTPTKVKHMEREINREKWLQQRKSHEISKLDAIEKMNTNWLSRLKNEIEHSNNLVKHAEEQIKDRLKPLLEKAEEISLDEAKREENYQNSINRRLADIASQKAMSEGERLAEYILDDLIQEAALDLQRIEEDEHAEMEAAFMLDRTNLETIAHRLQMFEAEEEKIRRHWKNVQYSEMNSEKFGTNFGAVKRGILDDSHNFARSVMFTATVERKKPPPVPDQDIEPMNQLVLNEIRIPDAQLNTILLFKQRFENFLDKSIHNSWKYWNIHPHDILDEFTENILDELLGNVTDELNENCNKFVDDIYEKEFLNVEE